MNQRNSSTVVWIDTSLHRATAVHCCDGTCRQGRDCPQVVARHSLLAGKPIGKARTRLDVAIVLGVMAASAAFSGWMVYSLYAVVTK